MEQSSLIYVVRWARCSESNNTFPDFVRCFLVDRGLLLCVCMCMRASALHSYGYSVQFTCIELHCMNILLFLSYSLSLYRRFYLAQHEIGRKQTFRETETGSKRPASSFSFSQTVQTVGSAISSWMWFFFHRKQNSYFSLSVNVKCVFSVQNWTQFDSID